MNKKSEFFFEKMMFLGLIRGFFKRGGFENVANEERKSAVKEEAGFKITV